MSLALSPTFPPSLRGLLRRHRCRRFISEAQPLTLQAGGAPPLHLSASPPLHLSASPPVLLALQVPVLHHGDITHSAFVKVNMLRVGERLENHRRRSSLTCRRYLMRRRAFKGAAVGKFQILRTSERDFFFLYYVAAQHCFLFLPLSVWQG